MAQSVFETALPDDVAACLGLTSSGKLGGFGNGSAGFRHAPLMMQTTLCNGGSGPVHSTPSQPRDSDTQLTQESLKQRSASGDLPVNSRAASAAAATAAPCHASPFCTAASEVMRTFSDSLSIMFTEFRSDRGFSFGGSKSAVPSPPATSEPVSPLPSAPAAGMACLTNAGLLSHLCATAKRAGTTAAANGGSPNLARTSVPSASIPVNLLNAKGACAGAAQRHQLPLRSSLPTNAFATAAVAPPGSGGGGTAAQACPAHGIKAVCGKRSKMEDMFQVQANFFDLSVSPNGGDQSDMLNKSCPARFGACSSGRRSSASKGSSVSPPLSAPLSPSCGVGAAGEVAFCPIMEYESYNSESSCDTLHFFGVYDGHGGTQASEHCAKRLHHHLGQALAETCGTLAQQPVLPYCDKIDKGGLYCEAEWNLCSTETNTTVTRAHHMTRGPPGATSAGGDPLSSHMAISPDPENPMVGDLELGGDICATDNSFVPEGSSSFGSSSSSSGGSSSGNTAANVSVALEEALREAFLRTDAEFAVESSAPMVGSTAVVALVGSRKLWVANCGDSRAVLCRAAKAIQLTDDHKPEREDEAERVERAGGQVLYWNGHRVMGVLAMSRAIGDHALRPYVICEPEITVMTRTDEDDFLLLASDGLWDVMSNQEATSLAIRCMRRAREKGASKKAAVRIAASVLTKAAMDRGSKDNITVVIVDLSGPGGTPTAAAGAGAAAEDEESPDDSCNSLNASSTSVAGRV